MARPIGNLFRSQAIAFKTLLAIVVVAALFVSIYSYTEVQSYIEQQIVQPINFRVRSKLGRDPKLHPKLKIFNIDDTTANWLRTPSPNLPQWSALLSAIDQLNPEMVFVDQIFQVGDYQTKNRATFKQALRDLRRLHSRVIAGAFVAPQKIRTAVPLELKGKSQYDPKSIGASPISRKPFFWGGEALPLAGGEFVYGPHPNLLQGFRYVGHIHYEGKNVVTPYFRVKQRYVLPHMALYAAKSVRYRQGNLYVDGKKVTTNGNGQILLNFSPYPQYLASSKSLKNNFVRALNGKPLKGINSGDYVFILPMAYTGNTDFKRTPFGYMPGGYAHVALLNSILTKHWIQPVHANIAFSLLGAVLGVLLTFKLSPFFSALISLAFGSIWIVFSLYLFSFFNVYFDWLLLVLAMGISGASVIVLRSRNDRERAILLRSALEGAVSPQSLRSIISSPSRINVEAREQVVTVMFVDVVGYSLLAENQAPRIAFDQLKRLLSEISAEVHRFGGIVNKTLGDGLLCLFGYDFETEKISSDHAERAVACAIKVQQRNLKANLHAFSAGDQVYPLRIGLHTASVFLGNLGSTHRLDFTAVGNGVNYAKRMEDACEMHCILFSATTKDLIASLGLDPKGLKKRMINIKHHTNLIESYEYDPFFEHPGLRAKALEAYRQCASLARLEQRYTLNNPESIVIQSSVGNGVLINYSPTGMSIKLRSMLVKGSTLVLTLDSRDGLLAEKLREQGILQLKGEVRWVYSETDGHVHGILFRDFSETLSSKLIEILRFADLRANMSKAQPLEDVS